ncbi:Basic helix-loop-helix DNA-binding superfamily protein [Melia azedarach]|uniref:Basic helix-loop-helix DNA-binding superfamily protein n=1 Tax=Melia azedarach TaxID=155640 RepID=A0ACC1X2Y7_MELAZ|nr:Basic helix-loop-helix DNA-binding superfamily protein [Melia azedarach]
MAQYFLLCLILAEAFLGLAMAASENTRSILYPEASSSSNPPALSPSISHDSYKAAAPSTRKLGKHQPATVFSPSEAPQATSKEENIAENSTGQVEEIRLKKNHHSIDKSIAGGGVILGGLATTFLVAVFCYIRATERHKTDTQKPNYC